MCLLLVPVPRFDTLGVNIIPHAENDTRSCTMLVASRLISPTGRLRGRHRGGRGHELRAEVRADLLFSYSDAHGSFARVRSLIVNDSPPPSCVDVIATGGLSTMSSFSDEKTAYNMDQIGSAEAIPAMSSSMHGDYILPACLVQPLRQCVPPEVGS